MKLLFDQNISFRVILAVQDLFPGAVHVKSLGLDASADLLVWNYAQKNRCIIVSKDSDFYQRSLLAKDSPKVIWIRRGNCSTDSIVELIRGSEKSIASFVSDTEATVMVVE